MGRKRRRRKLNPPPPPVGDPFDDFMKDLIGQVRNTLVQGVRQIIMPATPMFEVKDNKPRYEPEAKPAQVISIRTEK